MRRTTALISGTLIGLAFTHASAQSEERSLLRGAERQREAAEAALARSRKARLSARAALTRRLQDAYARLADVEGRAESAEAELERAQRQQQEAARTRLQAEQAARRITRLLGQAAQIDPADRVEDTTAFLTEVEPRVAARLRDLDQGTRIRNLDEQVLGRDGQARPARLLRVGRVTSIARPPPAESEAETASGFVREETGGLPIIVGPPLTAAQLQALRTVRPGENGQLPLDIDGALTRVEAEPPRISNGGLKAGGIFVWPILAVGLLGVLLFAERFYYFVIRPVAADRVPRVLRALQSGDPAGARRAIEPVRTDLDRVLSVGIDTFDEPRPVREQSLETALLREEPVLERGVGLLGAVAGLAPLLGLLGTVTGMISTFDVISSFGTGNPRLLSGGISVALITTQLGLVVAVPALLAHAWVTRAVAKRQATLEEARTALLSLNTDSEGPPS